jgi:hypothetical protein
MFRPLKLQIAIILLAAMAGILALRQAQGQAMSATARAAVAPADNGTARTPDKKDTKSASTTGSSRWTAGTTSFATPAKDAWGGGQGFSSAPKSAWTPGSEAISQGVQPGGVWHTRPSFSTPPEGASSADRTEAESFSPEPATSRLSRSGMGSRQFGTGARQSTTSAHRFGTLLQGKSGGKPAIGIAGQRYTFSPTRSGGIRSMRGSQSGSLSAGQHGTIGLADRPSALSPGLGQHRLGNGLGRTGSDFDLNPGGPKLHSGQKPQ